MTRLTQEGRIDYNRKCEQWPLQWSAEKGKKFYYTPEWEKCRDEFLDGREKVCCKCGSTDRICVDHILPLRRFPKYKFFHENFQFFDTFSYSAVKNQDRTKSGLLPCTGRPTI